MSRIYETLAGCFYLQMPGLSSLDLNHGDVRIWIAEDCRQDAEAKPAWQERCLQSPSDITQLPEAQEGALLLKGTAKFMSKYLHGNSRACQDIEPCGRQKYILLKVSITTVEH
ncbi:uncharacterized protein ACOB8E_000368 [Sarcophilus harrisii]